MSSIGSIVIELSANIAKYESDMGKAAAIAEQRMKQIEKSIGIVKMAAGTLGVGFTVGATFDSIKEKIEGAIASAAGLQQLSERTGATAEKLAGLSAVAKLSGTGTEELAGGLQKLAKAQIDAQNGGQKTSESFKAIGIGVDSLKGKKPDEVFQMVAKRMAEYQDGAEKTVIAQNLLGKSGANLLPVMKDLVDVGELQVKITDAQIAAADELEKNQKRLTASTNAIYKTIGMELVPVLNAFTKALLETTNANDGVRNSVNGLAKDGSIRVWAEYAVKGVGLVIDMFDLVARAIEIVSKGVIAYGSMALSAAKGNFAEARETYRAMGEDAQKILMRTQFSDRLKQQLENIPNPSQYSAGLLKHQGADPSRPTVPTSGLGNANQGPKDDPAKKYLEGQIKAQEDFIASEKTLLQTREKTIDFYQNLEYFTLREAEEKKQTLIADYLVSVQAAYDKELAAYQVRIAQKNITDVERQDAVNRLHEAEKKRITAEVESSTKMVESQEKLLAVQRQSELATQESARQNDLANKAMTFQISLLGKGTLETLKAAEAKRIQLALDERIRLLKLKDRNADTSGVIAQAFIDTADAQARVTLQYNAQRAAIVGAQNALNKYAEDATNSAAQIEGVMASAFSGMEDALVSFTQTGKLSFSSLANSIVADITRIIIKQQISNAMGVAGSGGGMGLIGSVIGMIGGVSGQAAVASAMSGNSMDNLMGLTGGFGTVPGRASGGPVSAGGLYQVNENGPELLSLAGKQYLMMGNEAGSVTPNGGSSGGQGVNITIHNTIGNVASQSDVVAGMQIVKSQIISQISRNKSYGGALA